MHFKRWKLKPSVVETAFFLFAIPIFMKYDIMIQKKSFVVFSWVSLTNAHGKNGLQNC